MKSEWSDTITCQCGKVVPLEFAQSDSEGVDLCPACYIGLIGELIPKWISVKDEAFPNYSHYRRQRVNRSGVVETIYLPSEWMKIPESEKPL